MELEETEEWKKYVSRLKEKEKTLLQGDDVIHLTYLASILDNETLKEIEDSLKTVNLRLSLWDDSGVIKASVEDYSLQVYLVICNPITLEILKTIGLNTTWEAIKYSILKIHKKIFKTTSKQSSKISKEISFGIKLKVNDEIRFDFKLDGDLSEELILKSMDRALEFIKEHTLQDNPVHQLPIYSTLDRNTNEWKKINVIEEVKNKHKKKK